MEAFSATGIEINGYRGFARFRAEGFERVNLIVGRNNAGKTALLEALEIALANGHPGRVYLQSLRRQEWYAPVSEIEQAVTETHEEQLVDLRQMFHGRQLAEGGELTVAALMGPARVGLGLKCTTDPLGRRGVSARRLTDLNETWHALLVEDAAVTLSALVQQARNVGAEPADLRSVDVPRMSPPALARLWTDFVQPRRAEGEVCRALQLVDPTIEDIICVDTQGHRGWSSFLVGLKEVPARVPLGSLGEGVGRVLSLAMTSIAARGGTMLVDEIDTGLHHSVFATLWPWLISRARAPASAFQLFATTHSEDCVRGLAAVAAESDESARDVSLHRIVPQEGTTRRFSGRLLADAVESFLEVR